MTCEAMPAVVDRAEWNAARDAILDREKAHTREGDAIAAARRRLPMTEMPQITVTGPNGVVPLLDVFEGRRMLMAYFHMWHDGKPFEEQCEGCTFSTCHMQMLDYLHARGVTYAVFSEGPMKKAPLSVSSWATRGRGTQRRTPIRVSSTVVGSGSSRAICATATGSSRRTGQQAAARRH